MKVANSIKVNVFCHVNENSDEIFKGVESLFPFSLEENKIKIEKITAEGVHHNKIEIFEAAVEKESLVKLFIENLLENLGKNQVEVLRKQKASRLDGESNFFIRIEKKYWILEKKMNLTDSGNCYHIKINIAAYPKKRENAMKVVEKILCAENKNQ